MRQLNPKYTDAVTGIGHVIPASRVEFDDALEKVMDDFIECSELGYEEEYQNWLQGLNWSWNRKWRVIRMTRNQLKTN